MLAHDEAGPGLLPAAQDHAGAEVPVGDPQVPGLRAVQQRRHRDALACVRVLAGHHVHYKAAVGIVNHQRVPRQRRTAQAAQRGQPLLAGRQVVAVQHPQPPAGQARRVVQRRQHRRQPLGAATHKRAQDGRLGVVHLIIQRGQRHRQAWRLPCCRVQGWAQPQRHQRGQLHNRREQQLARILPLPVRLEHLVHPACRQRVLQGHMRHYARRRMLLKPLHNRRPYQPAAIQSFAHLPKLGKA